MAKKVKEPTVATSSSASIEAFEATKAVIAEAASTALLIKVTDESSLGIANQRLTSINNQLKLIEEKRVALKKPHLEAGTAIDSAAKEMSNLGNPAVAHLKNEIKEWNLAILRKEEELRKSNEEAKRLAEQEEYNKKCAEYLGKIKGWLEGQFAAADSIEKCDSTLSALQMVKPAAEMGKFQVEYKSLLEMYQKLLLTKKGELDGRIAKGTVKNHVEVLGSHISSQIDSVVQAETQKVSVVAETNNLEQAALESQKATNIRWNWKFELTDIEKVPLEWLCLDESKVKEYMKENKDVLVDGQIFNGIKFTKDMSVVTK